MDALNIVKQDDNKKANKLKYYADRLVAQYIVFVFVVILLSSNIKVLSHPLFIFIAIIVGSAVIVFEYKYYSKKRKTYVFAPRMSPGIDTWFVLLINDDISVCRFFLKPKDTNYSALAVFTDLSIHETIIKKEIINKNNNNLLKIEIEYNFGLDNLESIEEKVIGYLKRLSKENLLKAFGSKEENSYKIISLSRLIRIIHFDKIYNLSEKDNEIIANYCAQGLLNMATNHVIGLIEQINYFDDPSTKKLLNIKIDFVQSTTI